MAKSTNLNFTQTLKAQFAAFRPTDLFSLCTVSPASNGSNLTSGTRTFTAAIGSGTLKTGGAAASWTAMVSDSRVVGEITLVYAGDYLTIPTDLATNAATVDSGSSNATWAFPTSGIMKTLYTGGTNDSVIKAINVSSMDSAARIMTLYMSDASNTYNTIIGAVNIPLTAGTGSGATASIDLLGGVLLPSLPYDANGKRVLPVPAGYIVKASVPAVTAAKLISVQTWAEDY